MATQRYPEQMVYEVTYACVILNNMKMCGGTKPINIDSLSVIIEPIRNYLN